MRLRLIASTTLAVALAVGAIASCAAFSGEPEDDAVAVDAEGGASGDASDGGFVDCRTRPIASWSEPERLGLVGPAGEVQLRDPFVTADGLTLYLGHLDGDGWRVFRALRTSRSAPWGTPSELPGFRAPSYARPYPSAAVGPGDEVVAAIAGVHTDMGAIVRDGGAWGATLYEELQRTDVEFAPTVTADGTTIVYVEVNAPRPNDQFRILLQSSRGAGSRTSPWSGAKQIADGPDGGSALPPGLDSPALTSDGLGLFYVTIEEPHLVRYATRKVRASSFFGAAAPPQQLPALSAAPGFASRVRSMTEDGCEVYLTSDRGGVEEAWFARRR